MDRLQGQCVHRIPFCLLHDFRCHPARGAYKCVTRHLLIAPSSTALHRGCHTKVSQQNSAVFINQDIACLLTDPASIASAPGDNAGKAKEAVAEVSGVNK